MDFKLRVGQSVLTENLLEGRVVCFKNGLVTLLLENSALECPSSHIVCVLRGPTQPETEDIPFVSLNLEAQGTPPKIGTPFSFGTPCTWELEMNGGSIEIKGTVLSSTSQSTTLSEWGSSAEERVWIVPTGLLKWASV